MTYIIFARWFGLVSVILALGILFNLEDARDMAKHMVKSDSGYIMGGVLPTIFGSLSLMFANSFELGWTSKQWKRLIKLQNVFWYRVGVVCISQGTGGARRGKPTAGAPGSTRDYGTCVIDNACLYI